jgi:FlaG/FlaF family flagellin (archaellin)
VESLRIQRRRLDTKAVNQVIAALLLIAVVVAAAVLLYVFSVGLVATLSAGGGQQTKQQVIMESYAFPVNGPLTVTVRNTGLSSVDLSKADFFINGQSATPGPGCSVILTVGGSCTTTLNLTAGYTGLRSGVAYTLKIVTPDGAVFSYSCTYGASG